jgi:hypothetical protein
MINFSKAKKDELNVLQVIDEITGTRVGIPMDESNPDYQRYLAWLEDPEAENTSPIL